MKQDVGRAGGLGVPRNIPCSTLFQPCSTVIDLVPFFKSAKKWNKVCNSTMAKAMASKQNARCRGGPWAPRTPACSSHNPLDHELWTLFRRDLGIKGLDTSFHRIGLTGPPARIESDMIIIFVGHHPGRLSGINAQKCRQIARSECMMTAS